MPTPDDTSATSHPSAARASMAGSSTETGSSTDTGNAMHTGKTPWPLARAGYLYVTFVGFCWGAIWSTGRVRNIDGLWVFTGMPKWSFGRGGSCVGGCYLTNRNDGAKVLKHERVHQQQWRTYGLAMPILYALAGRDPLRNRFEIEAGLADGGYLPRKR